jgi:hypothetical protein
VDRAIEPRLNQIFTPLLSIIDDPAAHHDLRDLARQYQREQIADRGMDSEAQVLEVINELLLISDEPRLSIKDITTRFVERFGDNYERKGPTKWIGSLVRKRLGLKPQRLHGTFVIPLEDMPKLKRLREKYGLGEPVKDEGIAPSMHGDVG